MEAGRCNGMKSPFRWLLAAARYAAASVMTVLILIVMVKAIKVLLQPVSLSLSVAQGCMFVRRIDDVQDSMLEFQFTLRVGIPRSGAHTYFSNITAYLFDKNSPPASSPYPANDCLIFFATEDIMAPPQQQDASIVTRARVMRDPNLITVSFFDMLSSRSDHDIITSDVTMRLDGIVSQVTSTWSYNRSTTYYCWPLVIGLDLEAVTVQGNYKSLVLEDVFCREEQGKHLI